MFAPDSKPLTRRDAAAKPFDHLLGARTQPRIQGELPDLSERLAPPPRPVAAPPAAARPGAAPPPPAAPAEPDTFSTQLGMLAERVSERMDQLGVPAAPAPRARVARPGAPPAAPPEPHAEVTDRFAQFCEAGRTEVPAP